jgi:hypothetical protein
MDTRGLLTRVTVDIFSMPAAQEEGLVVVELFLGISATTEGESRSRNFTAAKSTLRPEL